jgi:glycerol transport system permease protein
MAKPHDNRAWFLVLPVVALVAFSAVIPVMTVVNYSVQDTFGNNQFFWNGTGWFQELLDPSTDLGGRFFDALWRTLLFSLCLLIEIPLGIAVALSMPRRGLEGSACLVLLALPLLIPWNVVGTIWQVFARRDIGLLGCGGERPRHRLQLHAATRSHAWITVVVMDVWHWTSLVALLCYAGLRAIPDAYYQAARIDGAGRWAVFRAIQLPKMRAC